MLTTHFSQNEYPAIPVPSFSTFPPSAAPSSPNLLIIDDEEVCRFILKSILCPTYNLHIFARGEEGLEYLEAHRTQISLILLDLMMPELNGLDILHLLKKSPLLCSIPVVIQSASGDRAEMERALEEGAVAYIEKPYSCSYLLTRLHDILNQGENYGCK